MARLGLGLRLTGRQVIEAAPAGPIAQPDGYDIFLFYGDSLVNMGHDSPRTGVDIDRAGAYQFTGPAAALSGVTASIISSDITPVWTNHGDATAEGRIKLAEVFAREYLDVSGAVNRRTLVCVMGRSGQSIDTPPSLLAVGNTHYVEAIPQFNSALSAAKTELPGSRIRGIIVAAGTNDANGAGVLDPVTFQAAFQAICSSLRADVTEASEAPILTYGPSPGAVDTDKNTMRTAYANVAAILPNMAHIDVSGTPWTDNTHPDAAAERTCGARAAIQMAATPEPRLVAAFTIVSQSEVVINTSIDSAPFMVRGIGVGITASLTVTGGETAVAPVDDPTNFGAFSPAAKTVRWGDMVRVRQTSSALGGTQTDAVATITGPANARSATFSVTTAGGFTQAIRMATGDFTTMNGKVRAIIGGGYKEAA